MSEKVIHPSGRPFQQHPLNLTAQASNDFPVEEIEPVSLCQMIRFADRTDYILITLGVGLAIAIGTALPVAMMIWGRIIAKVQDPAVQLQESRRLMFQMIWLGLGALGAGWGMVTCWKIVGQRQGVACRKQYLQSLLRQQLAWFDSGNQLQITAKFNDLLLTYQQAINDKVPLAISSFSMLVTALIIAFVHGWLMTLILICCLLLIFFGAFLFGLGHMKHSSFKMQVGKKTGALAEQSIRAIKTVKHLNGQEFESTRYNTAIEPLVQEGPKLTWTLGLGTGILYGGLLFKYALGFWFGSHCIEGDKVCPASIHGGDTYSMEDVFVIFLAVHFALFVFIQLSPAIKKILQGKLAAAEIFRIIDRESLIKSPENPEKIDQFKGVFRFENVTFAYPKSKELPILKRLNLQINCKKAALVGHSGCGKSTILQLMLRLYDPDEGRVTLDGVDLRDLDLAWLRSQIGYVGQQPVLFAMSLRDNLLSANIASTQEEINAALLKSQSYNFVEGLQDKLETYAGAGGRQISGGQKQRLAIARVLLKKPRILLLDEATSALDRVNENLIQMTLDQLSAETVTVTVAHRLNTIKNSDQIYVIKNGKVAESGQFNELECFKSAKYSSDEMTESEQKSFKQEYHRRSTLRTKELDKISQALQQDKSISSRGNIRQPEEVPGSESEAMPEAHQVSLSRCIDFLKSRYLYCLGLFLSLCHGLAYPFFCIFVAKLNVAFYNFHQNQTAEGRSDINFYCLIFFLFGIGQFFSSSISSALLYQLGDQMSCELRKSTYSKILKLPVRWLEKPEHSSSAMVNLLDTDCEAINKYMNSFIGFMVEVAAVTLGGIVISFFFEWRLALVSLGLTPLILLAESMRSVFSEGKQGSKMSVYNLESRHMSEAVMYIKTVQAISAEGMFVRQQENLLHTPMMESIKSGLFSGFLFGLAQLLLFSLIGIMFFLGALFTKEFSLEIGDSLTVMYIFVIGGVTSGNKIMMMPDPAPVKESIQRVFQVLDSEDEEDIQIKHHSKMLKSAVTGQIAFEGVKFSYESREKLFENFRMKIPAGQTVGLAGHSGSGKSTLIQLLLRFYDPAQGKILLDGIDLRDYDLHYLRGCFGVVEQQPVLFDESVGYNVVYNMGEVSEENILFALQEAQLTRGEWKKLASHDVTSSVQDIPFFERKVGVNGSHLSGGQKQRIAIARAILRSPSLLVFDEATSALDGQNEAKVQRALDAMREGKTTVTVAHRISTLRTSQRIIFMKKGIIAEEGSYDSLVKKQGAFYRFEKGLLQQ